MLSGILYSLIATALWGSTYLTPFIFTRISPVNIIIGRFFIFGLFCLALFIIRYQHTPSYPKIIWKKTLISSMMTLITCFFTLYSTLLIGPGIPPLIIALSPISITLYGNWKNKELSPSLLFIPLLCLTIGLFLMHIEKVALLTTTKTLLSDYSLGIFLAFTALSTWSWLIVYNRNILKQYSIPLMDWICMRGVGFVSILSIFWLPFNYHILFSLSSFTQDDFTYFFLFCLTSAILNTGCPQYFWHKASTLLPIFLLGQLYIFEIIFSSLYYFIYLQRLPTPWEITAILIIICGITRTTHLIYKKALTTF